MEDSASQVLTNSILTASGSPLHIQRVSSTPEGLPKGKTSIFWAIFLVVNAALGAGLLAFPLSFYMTGGIVTGILIELVRNDAGVLDAWRSSFEKMLMCAIASGWG